MITVYDTEVYKNLLLYVFYEVESKQYKVFAIHPWKDDRIELMEYLKIVKLMIGFNNLKFDYPLLDYLINILAKKFNIPAQDLMKLIFAKSTSLIKDKIKYPEIRKPLIQQLDIYRIHHFDNVAKATSLKMLEFVYRMPNIAELPYPPDTFLNQEQIEEVIIYCKNDVYATNIAYEKTQQEIIMREKLSEVYKLPMMNWNDPKIGESILIKLIKERLQKDNLGKTPRDKIVIKDILFNYICFESEPFKAIHNWFAGKVLTETKKVFSELPFSEVEAFKQYVNTTKKNTVKGKLKTLNVIHNGFQYDFGLGGIHGSIQSGIYEADDDYSILDIDVKGYYPNESIINRLYPFHLTEAFCDILQMIGEEREKYAKKTPENTGLKLAGNGSFGKSNSEFSPLYDPQYTMSVTINGQLLLCMLAEGLEIIPDLVVLQANTDGMTLRIKKSYEGLARIICSKWEKLTNLTLEYSNYSKMVINNVNNYLAVDTKGNIKRKGLFGYKMIPGERELHKNHSMLIVPKALEQYYVYGIPIEQSIMNGDKWDFFKRVKLNSNGKLIGRSDNGESIYGKITRYYVSEYGETLIKILPPLKKPSEREFNIEADFICTVCNKVDDSVLELMEQNINYQYYIQECEKIITAINLHQELQDEES